MDTVFSHIVQKRFSQVAEDVATDALAFILRSSDGARNGFMKLLRGIEPGLPELRFQTQPSEDNIRPDMCGFDGSHRRVFIENKFWAGLTDNQPASYLAKLGEFTQPTVLLFVVPSAREQSLWRELLARLASNDIKVTVRDAPAGVPFTAARQDGVTLALTSWSMLLSGLKLEVADDRSAMNDLVQLGALCEAADAQAFIPFAGEAVTGTGTPVLVLQLGTVVKEATDLAITERILDVTNLRPTASWDRVGRYVRFPGATGARGIVAWMGVQFDLWRRHEGPLWLIFPEAEALEVKPMLESWGTQHGKVTVSESGHFSLRLGLPTGEDKDRVLRSIADELKQVAHELSGLPSMVSDAGPSGE